MQAVFHIKRDRINRFHVEHFQSLKIVGKLNFHSHIEIFLVNQGKMDFRVNDTVETLHDGEFVVVPSYASHQFLARHGSVDCTFFFIPTFLCPDFMEAIADKHVLHPFIRNSEALKKLKDAASELEKNDLNAIEQAGYIRVILGTVLRYITLEEGKSQGDPDLPTKLLLYISEHFKEDLSTESIAKELGYSQRYVAERFRTEFHIGMNRYINTVRLKNALSLIRENKYTVTECAMESGFSSLRTFYRVFTEECGCSPKEYFKEE